MLSFTINFPENVNSVRSRLLFCKVLRFERTRCFFFLQLNFMITRSFFLMRWQDCRSSGSTDIPVSDSAWHTDCSRTSSAISDGTGLISGVSLLLYRALFKLLRSNWVISSSSSSLRLEMDRFELTISYSAWKSLKRSFSSKIFALMSFLKSDSHLPKKNRFICFNDSPSKIMKNAFYFILKVLFVLKILTFSSWLFGHVEKNGLIKKMRLISKFMTSQPG